jgi:hypothetical protein
MTLKGTQENKEKRTSDFFLPQRASNPLEHFSNTRAVFRGV